MTMTLKQSFDRERVPGSTVADLDLDLVIKTMNRGSELGRYKGELDPHAYLLRFGGVVADGDTWRALKSRGVTLLTVGPPPSVQQHGTLDIGSEKRLPIPR